MKECVMVAAPGGNPAPLVALIWALHEQWQLRVRTVHLVLYESSRHYVESELLGGAEPLEDLRTALGDTGLAEVVQHDTTLLARVVEACQEIWYLEPHEMSDGYDFDPASAEQRQKRLAPIRSRLRRKLRDSLRGHPHRSLIVPRQESKGGTTSVERIEAEPESIRLRPGPEGLLAR